jgi:hypothetical protein
MKTGEKKEPSINHADRKQITGRFSSASSSGWRNSKKLGGDMTSLANLACRYAAAPRVRGRQWKEPAPLDAWLHDGPAADLDRLCGWHA